MPDVIVLPPRAEDKHLAVSKSKPKGCTWDEEAKPQPQQEQVKKLVHDDTYQYFGMEQVYHTKLFFVGDDVDELQETDRDASVDSNVEPQDDAKSASACLRESFLGIVVNGQFKSNVEETMLQEFQIDPVDWEAM